MHDYCRMISVSKEQPISDWFLIFQPAQELFKNKIFGKTKHVVRTARSNYPPLNKITHTLSQQLLHEYWVVLHDDSAWQFGTSSNTHSTNNLSRDIHRTELIISDRYISAQYLVILSLFCIAPISNWRLIHLVLYTQHITHVAIRCNRCNYMCDQ